MKRFYAILFIVLASLIAMIGCQPATNPPDADLPVKLVKGFEDGEQAIFTNDFVALGWGGATVELSVRDMVGFEGSKALKVDISQFRGDQNWTDRFGVNWIETGFDLSPYAGGVIRFLILYNPPAALSAMTVSVKILIEGPGQQLDLESPIISANEEPQIVEIAIPANCSITNLVRFAVQILGKENVPAANTDFTVYVDHFVFDK